MNRPRILKPQFFITGGLRYIVRIPLGLGFTFYKFQYIASQTVLAYSRSDQKLSKFHLIQVRNLPYWPKCIIAIQINSQIYNFYLWMIFQKSLQFALKFLLLPKVASSLMGKYTESVTNYTLSGADKFKYNYVSWGLDPTRATWSYHVHPAVSN